MKPGKRFSICSWMPSLPRPPILFHLPVPIPLQGVVPNSTLIRLKNPKNVSTKLSMDDFFSTTDIRTIRPEPGRMTRRGFSAESSFIGRKLMLPLLILFVALASSATSVWAQFDLDKVLKGISGASGSGLSDVKIGSGLQEALKVGTQNAVLQTSQVDGFLANKAIKILLPKSLQSMEQPLRLVGYGPQIDEFVIGMNRAADRK